MSRYHSYITSAVKIISQYNGNEPFAGFLKKFFSADKKYGSKDRKIIAELCFGYYRIAHAFKEHSPEEIIIYSQYILGKETNPFLETVNHHLNNSVTKSTEEKFITFDKKSEDVFPFSEYLSPAIDKEKYYLYLLSQPDTFLRIRFNAEKVFAALNENSIPFQKENKDAIRLSHSVKLDDVFKMNRDVVVQDMNSQHSLDDITAAMFGEKIIDAWDCCAASGGKSLLLYDRFKTKVRLSVSDVREKILINLKNRFQEAKVPLYKAFVTDSTMFDSEELYDLVICDAPCSGSGTWARTPEQLFYFKKNKIAEYALLQQKIISKTLKAVKAGGYYCYITCSVFKEENEIAAELIAASGFTMINSKYHIGYDKKADTLFSAVFQKSVS